jgi:hypothetical protein
MHEIVEVLPLFLSIGALLAGPFVYRAAVRARALVVALHVALIAAIFGLVVLEILPECVAEAGWPALGVAALGLLGPVLAERGMQRAVAESARSAAGANATVGGAAMSLVVAVAVMALGLHAFTDGVALVAGHEHLEHAGHDHGHGLGLLAALVLHRLPEGATIYWLLRSRGERAATLGLAAVAVATVAGFVFGDAALPALEGVGIALLQAFVGGVLMHVIIHHRKVPQLEAAHA